MEVLATVSAKNVEFFSLEPEGADVSGNDWHLFLFRLAILIVVTEASGVEGSVNSSLFVMAKSNKESVIQYHSSSLKYRDPLIPWSRGQ